MANASVQQSAPVVNITFERVGKVIRQMKDDCGWCGPEFNAISKAQMELGAEGWSWDAATKTLTIESRTVRGKRYRVTEHTCCEATKDAKPCKLSGQVHWHHAAWSILDRASRPAPPRIEKTYDEVLDEVDELF